MNDDLDIRRAATDAPAPGDSGGGSHHSGRLETPRPGPAEVDGLIEDCKAAAEESGRYTKVNRCLIEAADALAAQQREIAEHVKFIQAMADHENELDNVLAAAEKEIAELKQEIEYWKANL